MHAGAWRNRLPTQRKVLKMKLEVSGSENEPAFFWASNRNGFIVRLLLRTGRNGPSWPRNKSEMFWPIHYLRQKGKRYKNKL